MAKPKRKLARSPLPRPRRQLDRARRREAAQAGPTVRRRVDLANLDTPDVTHADHTPSSSTAPAGSTSPRSRYRSTTRPSARSSATTTTFKADDDQLLYLVEVLRQIRGAFGQHCRINLTPAEPHVEERRIAGPAVRQARSRVEEGSRRPRSRRAAGHARGARRGAQARLRVRCTPRAPGSVPPPTRQRN